MITADDVLDFWLGPMTDPDRISKDVTSRWFKKDPALDDSIRERFEAAMDCGRAGELDDWQTTAKGALALCILLDQFPRNSFRGSPRSFAYDPKARVVARLAISRGFDREVMPVAALFFHLPFEHSEDAADQAIGVERLERASAGASGEVKALLDEYLKYAVMHKKIIDRFGRFPHRNAILGRDSTPEEIAFLKEPGSSF